MMWRRRIRQVHRWLGVLIGIQLLFWVFGGLVMSSFRLDTVRGAHQAAETAPADLRAERVALDINAAMQRVTGPVQRVELVSLLGDPVYRLHSDSKVTLVDARSGVLRSPVEASVAARVAALDFSGEGEASAPEWLDQPELEFRGRDLPLWRVRMNDTEGTAIYVSASTGEVVARRNHWWRAFDFVWMLHIMDYDDRDDFNNPLLIIAAATALGFVLSGFWMLVLAYRP